MSNKFMKKSLRGFTLIELMVVIAIIGILATVVTAPITTYLKKARDAKKVADISQIKSSLEQYAFDNNSTYPATLGALSPKYINALPTNTLSTTPDQNKYMYVTYADAAGKIYSYHLGVALEFQSASIQGLDADCTQTGAAATNCATAATTVSFTNKGAASGTFGANGYNSAVSSKYPAVTTPLALVAGDNDFRGQDDGDATAGPVACVFSTATQGASNCVYDVVP